MRARGVWALARHGHGDKRAVGDLVFVGRDEEGAERGQHEDADRQHDVPEVELGLALRPSGVRKNNQRASVSASFGPAPQCSDPVRRLRNDMPQQVDSRHTHSYVARRTK